MEMIFDTAGTGFDTRFIKEMMEQPEIPFLSGLGSGPTGLGDEIMLLDGIDDLAANYPHGYDDGPARTYTMPSSDRGTTYDFASGEVDLGRPSSRLGAALGVAQRGAWPAQHEQSYRYSGLGKPDYRYTGLGKPDYRYTGLGAQGAWPERNDQSYRYSGLGEMPSWVPGAGIGAAFLLGAWWLSR